MLYLLSYRLADVPLAGKMQDYRHLAARLKSGRRRWERGETDTFELAVICHLSFVICHWSFALRTNDE